MDKLSVPCKCIEDYQSIKFSLTHFTGTDNIRGSASCIEKVKIKFPSNSMNPKQYSIRVFVKQKGMEYLCRLNVRFSKTTILCKYLRGVVYITEWVTHQSMSSNSITELEPRTL